VVATVMAGPEHAAARWQPADGKKGVTG